MWDPAKIYKASVKSPRPGRISSPQPGGRFQIPEVQDLCDGRIQGKGREVGQEKLVVLYITQMNMKCIMPLRCCGGSPCKRIGNPDGRHARLTKKQVSNNKVLTPVLPKSC